MTVIDLSFVSGKSARTDVPAIVDANRNTSGTGCWLTIPITIVKEYSWIGSCSPLVASAGAIRLNNERGAKPFTQIVDLFASRC